MNDTTPPNHIQEWATSENGRATIDQSTARMRRGSAHNGNGELGHAEDLPEFDGTWKPITLADLNMRPQNERPWLVNELLPHDGISLLAGAPKAGKSTSARCLATTVAGEKSIWFGKAVNEGVVLHLALEERMETVRNHYNLLNAPADRIVLIENPWPKPKDPVAKLQSLTTRFRPVLVIIDPLIRCVTIRNTSDYAEVSEALDPFISLARRFKTHIMFVHHANKHGGEFGNEVMGSQAMTGSVDTIISLKNVGGQRMFRAWGRDGVEIPDSMLNLEGGWLEVVGTKREVRAHDLRNEVIALLEASKAPMGKEEIQQELKCQRQTLIEVLDAAVEDGDIREVKGGKSGRKILYKI